MKTKIKDKIEVLEKEIEELKEMIVDKNPRFLDESQKYKWYLDIEKAKLQSYEEAQKLMDEEMQKMDNVIEYWKTKSERLEKKRDETLKNIIDEIELERGN